MHTSICGTEHKAHHALGAHHSARDDWHHADLSEIRLQRALDLKTKNWSVSKGGKIPRNRIPEYEQPRFEHLVLFSLHCNGYHHSRDVKLFITIEI